MIETQIAALLLEIEAVRLSPAEPFTWASGIKSPIYCDNRKTLSYPEVRQQVKAALVAKSEAFRPFDVVAGVATAGIAHGALLADALNLPFVYVRSEAKKHGMKNLIEGDLQEGQRVLVVEDLISTGGSSLKAVESVREAGGHVQGVLAIFTYGFPEATAAFDEAACPLVTLSNYPSLLQVALEKGYIQQEALSVLSEWSKNPRDWHHN